MIFYISDNVCTIYKLALHKLKLCLEANGHTEAMSPDKADILITCLCASFNKDEERSLQILDNLTKLNKELHVIGCMVKLRQDKMPRVNLYYTWELKQLFLKLVPNPMIQWEDIILPTTFRRYLDYRIYNPNKHFVGLCYGCAFDCSYCSHKIGAGSLVSRNMDEILFQITDLIHHDIDTIVLTGIDTASYGKDIGTSLSVLLNKIISITDKPISYHIAQFNPEGITEDIIKCCSNPRVTDLQLPIQTINPRILKLMNRNYSSDDIAKFIERINHKNLFLRTDLMIGFPTETDAEFQSSLPFIAHYFKEVAIYKYEHKEGTPISKLSIEQCDNDTVDEHIKEATEYLRGKGCLVHYGGQDIKSMLASDKIKYERGI